MSTETMVDEYLNRVLDQLEDTLNTYLLKCNNYQEVQNVLEKEESISFKVLKRLLAVCVCDLKQSTQHAASALSVISAVLAKLKSEEHTDASLLELLLPSALAIINMLKLTTQVKVDTLPVLSIEVLLSYPDSTLVAIVMSHTSDLIKIIDICTCKQLLEDKQQPIEVIDFLVFKLLVKLLKILPNETKEEFVKQGLTIWFAKIIPRAVALINISSLDVNTCTEILELLTDSLIPIDYAENPSWHILLECIYNPLKYPLIMKNLLKIRNDCWYRLWIIFVRLLKNQVTKVNNSSGSPINSMLPVVELAFKLEPKSRCQAFQCWNVLIDNFASELNETPAHVHKRMKLLIVPLRSSNAKVEEIALAKFNTWWHLMRKFHSKMDSFTDMILIPFLHFCFGKLHASGRVIFSPGQFSDKMKKQCMQALVEIAGHVECEGCVTLPKLKNKLISARILVDHWNDWVHSLKTAIIIAAMDVNESSQRQVTCLWKSFVLTIGEMHENNVRKDLFNELLAIITQLRQTYAMNDKLADISFNVLIGTLFDDDKQIRQLLKTKNEEICPIHTILNLIINPSFTNFFSRKKAEELVCRLKPMTNLIMDGSLTSPDSILKWLFNDLIGNDNTLMLWAALTESFCESKHDITTQNLQTLLLWPLRFLDMYSNERSSTAWNNWHVLYNLVHSKLIKTSIDDEISNILSMHQIRDNKSPIEFPLCATLAVLKIKILQDDNKGYEHLAEILLKMMSDIDYQRTEKVFPILFDTVTLMADKALQSANVTLAKHTIDIVKIVLKLITQMFKQNDNDNVALIFAENLLKLLDDLFKIETYLSLKQTVVEELIECLPLIDQHSSLQFKLISMLKSFLAGNDNLKQPLYQKTIAAIEAFDNSKLDCNEESIQNAGSMKTKSGAIDTFVNNKLEYINNGVQKTKADDGTDNNLIDYNIDSIKNALCTETEATIHVLDISNVDSNTDNVQNSTPKRNSVKESKLTTPDNNGLRKKSANKEASIVNTVVDNGEEFVVVKSHWKFNPRKLTENQKEKLKRKREDIPALYQDLSQSQDEFKLTAWKSNDSQETTTTSSKSTSKSSDVGASVILQNLRSTDVVPKIMENILSDNASKHTKFNEDVISNKTNKIQQLVPVKDAKSPRMALKDRVFRNVKNLIEKSSLPHDDKREDLNVTINENVLKTPSTKANVYANLINSAPSKITCERPSRVIKKPKKFDDSELFITKKRRRSQNSFLQSDFEISDKHVEESTVHDSELNVMTRRRRSLNSSPLPDFEIPDKPLKESNVQTANKEDHKHIGIINKNFVPVVSNNETNDVHCTILSVKDICEDKVCDTLVENTQTLQNYVEDKMNVKQKCLDEMDVDGNSIVTEKSTNIDTVVEVTEVLTPKTQKLQIPNNDLPLSNVKEVSKKEKSTPNSKNKETNEEKSSVKKKRSRIEKQLLIDMVEGHPFLQVKSDKRITRKNVMNVSSSMKRKSLGRFPSEIKGDKKIKIKEKPCGSSSTQSTTVTVDESQEKSQFLEDLPMSEDIIESSQDSSITTVSMKSSKHILKKVPHVLLDNIDKLFKSKNVSNDIEPLNNTLSDQESKEDIELPENKTSVEETTEVDLTENMDTQPLEDKDSSCQINVVSYDESPIVINSEDTCLELDTQEMAEADTQPLDIENKSILTLQNKETDSSLIEHTYETPKGKSDTSLLSKSEYLEVPAAVNTESNCACSPLNDEGQRKKDFLNDTIEISPIKTMSPLREKKSPSPETSSDYVVIKLTSPVQSNGEPFEKCDSPEIFTEDKVSPDKRDQSPPRVVVSVQNASPSSSLSLKKNRPQMRSNGRAAHMLGLCAPDKLQAIMNSERSADSDESKKSANVNTTARRNLRILYNSVGENIEQHDSSENEDSENFLKFERSVPTANCSPAGPILKRKLADIVDEPTISPASKRKRVSFQDPPVSITVAVQKYIEPGVLRSPQSSTIKRLEKQLRTNMKSPKKLENVFKLDTILTKAVESFTEETAVASIDNTVSSMDQTPAVEIVKTSDLKDAHPICSELLDCTDPIDNIASKLSSPAMKGLFIKELKGKVETIGDLAKMTELEVNRLCIKAPKVKVAKRVLTDYASKKTMTQSALNVVVEPTLDATETVPEIRQTASVEVQTNAAATKHCEMQTVTVPVTFVHTQTDIVSTSHTIVQTDESGNKPTHDIISTCLSERPDFIAELGKQLEESSIQQIADNLSFDASVELLIKKMTISDSVNIIHQVLEKHIALDPSNEQGESKKLSFLQDYMCERFNSKDLILFCSELLQKIHDKAA